MPTNDPHPNPALAPRPADELLEIHRATVTELHRLVARRTNGDRALTEDVVQETWLRAIRSWADRGLPDDPPAWLRTVALNLLRSEARRRRPVAIDAAGVESLLAPAIDAGDTERTTTVRWALAHIPAMASRLLESFYLDGRTTRQLAEEHRASEKAIERRLARARRSLHAKLEPHLRQAEPSR